MSRRARSSRSNAASSRLSNGISASASATREQMTLRSRKPKNLHDLGSYEQEEWAGGVENAQEARVQWPPRIAAIILEFMMNHNFFSVSTYDQQSHDLFNMLWQTILSERDGGKESEFWSAHSIENLIKRLKTKIGSIRRELLSQGIVIPNPGGDLKRRFILKEAQEPSEASASPTPTRSELGTPTPTPSELGTPTIASEGMPSRSGSFLSRAPTPGGFATPSEIAAPARSSAPISRVFAEIEVITVLRRFLRAIRASQDPYPAVSELGEGASRAFQYELTQVCVEAMGNGVLPQWDDTGYSKMAELASAAERLGATWQGLNDQQPSLEMDGGEFFVAQD
ncbi:MAG: hypothetical protein M1840_008330 [Geoglossum simile]|nr:MAG: hypothetical protein M1840_008330 [Geoglossum simile]